MSTHHDPPSTSLAPPSTEGPCSAVGAVGDPLSDVLRAVRLTGGLFFEWDVSWPYTMPVPDGRHFAPIVLPGAQQIVSYHIIVEGTAWGGVPGEPPVQLSPGDVLLVPRGDAYVMASSPQACRTAQIDPAASLPFFERMAAGDLPFVVRDGGGGEKATRVVCGFLGCDQAPFNPVTASLPPLLRLGPAARDTPDGVGPLVQLALAESRQPRPGSQVMLLRLSELLFLEVVRRCLADEVLATRGFFAAMRDPLVGRALRCLHAVPEHGWTVAELAAAAGASRSQFAKVFTVCLGQSPMQYLGRFRVQLASRLLREGDDKVATIATAVGYGSEAAFSRAFSRWAGLSPSAFRDAARAGGPTAP